MKLKDLGSRPGGVKFGCLGAVTVKKTKIAPISTKQKAELQLRRCLKGKLIIEYEGKCQTCGTKGDWRGLTLSHIVPLSRGGKTTPENVLLECYPDHEKYEKHPELRGDVVGMNPDAIHIIDYLDLNQDLFLVGKEIDDIYQKLRGVR